MPRLRADVSLFFDAPSVEEAGPKMNELVPAVEQAGFDLWVGEASDDVTNDPKSNPGPTAYGPAA